MKCLVVDDSKLARRMVIKCLKEVVTSNLEIIEASNGQEAIERYTEHSPEICFMDLTMPIVDGFEATEKICQMDEDAQVIVISADIQDISQDRTREVGALGFIKKPINSNHLKIMLEQLELI